MRVGAVAASLGAVLVALSAPAVAGAVTPNDVVVSANPADWTPHVLDGQVKAIVKIGNTMFVGGLFTTVKEPGGLDTARSNIFAFDATTGAIDPSFAPTLDREVNALAAAPDGGLFVAGRFNTVNGIATKGLVKLDPATGQIVTAFKPRSNGAVFDMQVVGNELVIGGNFTKVTSFLRTVLAAVDVTTGAVDLNLDLLFAGERSTDHTTGTLTVDKLAVTPDGSRLVVIGNFTTVAGLQRDQLGVIDLTTTPASVANWATDRYAPYCPAVKWPAYLRDLAMSNDGTWFSVVTTGAYGGTSRLCDSTTRWDLGQSGSGIQPTWVDYTGGDSLFSVAITDEAVYVGGHQRWENNPFAGDRAGAGAVPRKGIAALDPVNGLPLTWNPGRQPRGVGVFVFTPTDDGLWFGSDTNYVAGEYHGRLAFFPAEGGTPRPVVPATTLPGLLYGLGYDDFLRNQTYDGSTFGAPTIVSGPPDGLFWSHARGAFAFPGQLYTGWDNGQLLVRSFDGTVAGPTSPLNLYGLTSSFFPISNVTGMFFDTDRERLYYTVAGDPQLYFRWFAPESQIVGAEKFVVSGNGDGLNWSSVTGLTLASGQIYAAVSNGDLYRLDFVDGRPVPASAALISGPSTGDGRNWKSLGLFVLSSP